MNDTYYFAYGSNLCVDRQLERTGAIRRVRLACLKDYRFAFNKAGVDEVYANIVPCVGDMVWGAVYLCSPQAMIWLDEYEGVKVGHYRRSPVEVETADGQIMQAETYIAVDEFIIEVGRPSKWYLDRILQGATEHSLPAGYVQHIMGLAGQAVG